MKYEAVFGNQELFDGASGDDVLVVLNDRAKFYYNEKELSELTLFKFKYRPNIAMRRIIKEPKRWTWENKKSGRLPEVGCEVLNTDMSISRYVLCEVIHVNADVVIVYNGELSQTYSHAAFIHAFNPIETPEEKAQREEDEFVVAMLDAASQEQLMSAGFKSGVIAAYRKLKGGE